jgi:hypothetical protein
VSDTNQLYVIAEHARGPIKIGRSCNAAGRLPGLQTGNPRPLRVVAAWELPYRSAVEAEQILLEELERHALVGEWLALSPSFIMDYMPDFFLANGFEGKRVA